MTSGLDDIKNRILESAKQEAAAIVKAATDEKNAKLQSVREEAGRRSFEILEESKSEAEIRYEEKLGAIRTELKRQLLTKREELIDDVWRVALEELGKYTLTPEYERSLGNMIISTAGMVEGDTVRVEANSRDLEAISRKKDEIQAALGRKLAIGNPIDCIGGVEVSDEGRKVVLDRTYEARIKRLKPELRSQLARILTGGLD
jgi:V/A-type H+-transporting ATPase subunit E